jgi:multidrug resistance efflux pump
MAVAFQHTLRCLDRERAGHSAWRLLLIAAALGAWIVWLTCAQVPVYAVSQSGRLEVQTKTHRAAAAGAGKVVRLSAALGALVSEDQVLLHLDDSVERRKLDEALVALEAIELRTHALQSQLTAEARVRESQRLASEQALKRAELALNEAGNSLQYQERLGRIADELHREELISHLEAYKSAQELSTSQLRREAVDADLSKQRADMHYTQELQTARIAGLSRELTDLDAARLQASAAVATARAQVDRRVVRAPIAGHVGSLAALEIGDVVREGDLIATIVPEERLRVVAEFAAADALGRVKPGQAARVRLDGFSIVEFGTLGASVQRVASEPQRGSVRVELSLSAQAFSRLPLEHGVPGRVEVRVESAAPWRMLMRSVMPPPTAADSALAGDSDPVVGSAG